MSIACLVTAKTISRICWLLINLIYLATTLKDVRVIVPRIVKRGDNATLSCYYDLQNDTLYSVKWYKGRREFYRYTPRQNPPMKVFAHSGIQVERLRSNASHIVLTAIGLTASGKYSCEVSADAPSFHTNIMSGDLEVIEIPESGPRIESIDRVYGVGDIFSANCTQDNSRPTANLTWLINNVSVSFHQIVMYDNAEFSSNDGESSILGIKFVITPKHFRYSNLKLTCIATIYNIYRQVTEKTIDLDASTNLILFDYQPSTAEDNKQSRYANTLSESNEDIKMHHMQVQGSTSSAPAVFRPNFPLWPAQFLLLYTQSNNQIFNNLGMIFNMLVASATLTSCSTEALKLRMKHV